MNKNINKNMNKNTQLEISSDFDKFKLGLVNRIIHNYEDTVERQQAIDKIPDITIEQAIKRNAFCKEILPILWDATPPQNEKDYCLVCSGSYTKTNLTKHEKTAKHIKALREIKQQ